MIGEGKWSIQKHKDYQCFQSIHTGSIWDETAMGKTRVEKTKQIFITLLSDTKYLLF